MSLILKAKEIFKRGYVPSRGDEAYGKEGFCYTCFAHAAFNFTNGQLQEFENISSHEFFWKSPFANFSLKSIEGAKADMFALLKNVGLQVEHFEKGKLLKTNQWKVALYFSESFKREFGRRDWHLLLQEKDGNWSGKCGASPLVEKFETLQQYIPWGLNNRYELSDVLVLTNPNAKDNKKEDYAKS